LHERFTETSVLILWLQCNAQLWGGFIDKR
jgi:hypothetical protein